MKKVMRRGALRPTFRYVLLAAILVGAAGAVLPWAEALPFLAARSAGAFHAPEDRTGATGEILLDGEG